MHTAFVIPRVIVLGALLCASCSGTAKDQQGGAVTAEPAAQAAPGPAAEQARPRFADGAPSIDALMEQFVQALSTQDLDTLTKLRVSEAEYVDLIVPGTVPPGQPPRQVSEQPKAFFWNMLDTKSRYYADSFLQSFGGRPYRSHEVKFTKPAKEYAWYKAYGETRIQMQGDDDARYELLTGWVAEVDGRYKFIGYSH